MRIVAHPNENITRHLSEKALFIQSCNTASVIVRCCPWRGLILVFLSGANADRSFYIYFLVRHPLSSSMLWSILPWWLFVIPVLSIMWTLYNFWANLANLPEFPSSFFSPQTFCSCFLCSVLWSVLRNFPKNFPENFSDVVSSISYDVFSAAQVWPVLLRLLLPLLQWCFIYPAESFWCQRYC